MVAFVTSPRRPRRRRPCGEERYRRWSAYWSGATLDLHELYEWGYQDLRRINTRMWEIANELPPGAKNLVEVADLLDNDPARAIDGTDDLLDDAEGLHRTHDRRARRRALRHRRTHPLL